MDVLSLWVGPSITLSDDTMMNLNFIKDSLSYLDLTHFCFTWWFIWFSKNKVIFHDKVSSPVATTHSVVNFILIEVKSQSQDNLLDIILKISLALSKKNVEVSCAPLPVNGFKLNFDGSKLSNGQAFFGFTIRDHMGGVCLAGAIALSSDCSIFQAEAWGLREGVKAATFPIFSSLIVEGDNRVVSNSVRR